MGDDHEELTERLAAIVGAPHVSRSDQDPYRMQTGPRALRRGETTWVVRPGAASEIAVQGARYPEQLERMTGR